MCILYSISRHRRVGCPNQSQASSHMLLWGRGWSTSNWTMLLHVANQWPARKSFNWHKLWWSPIFCEIQQVGSTKNTLVIIRSHNPCSFWVFNLIVVSSTFQVVYFDCYVYIPRCPSLYSDSVIPCLFPSSSLLTTANNSTATATAVATLMSMMQRN